MNVLPQRREARPFSIRRAAAIAGLLLASLAAALGGWFAVSQPEPAGRIAMQRALEELDHDQTADAVRLLSRWENLHEWQSARKVVYGALLLKRGQAAAAIRQLARVDEQGPDRHWQMLYLARSLHAENRLAEAESVLRRLVAEDPANPEARRWLGVVYYDLGANGAGILELQALAQLEPADFRPHWLSGRMYQDFENYTEAATAYEQALLRKPPAKVAQEMLEQLAMCVIELRQYERAVTILKKLPPTASTETLLGRCAWNHGDAPAAQQHLQRALADLPDYREALLLDAEIRETQGDSSGALAILAEAVRLHPYDTASRYAYARLLRTEGHEQQASAELEVWKGLNDLALQLTDLNTRATASPHDAGLRRQLAEVCRKLGKTELAEMWQKAAAACQAAPPQLAQ